MATLPQTGPRRHRGVVAVLGVASLLGVAAAVVIAVAVFGTGSPPTSVKVTASAASAPGAPAGQGPATTPSSAPDHTIVGASAPTTALPATTGRPLSATSTSAATTVPLGSGTTTVTAADTGKRYHLHRGDRLVVNLTGPAIYTWTEATSSDGVVLARVAGSSGATATASFVAAADGESTVSATATPNCYPQCLLPSRLFKVTISVVG